MKRVLIYALAGLTLVFSSCEKMSNETTYTFIENSSGYEYLENEAPYGTDVTLEYVISEYTESGLKVASNMVRNLPSGASKKFKATEEAYYVTVKMQVELIAGNKTYNDIRYVSNVFLLKQNKHTNIEITDKTLFQTREPGV